MFIGIDFGTSNTSAAVYDGQEVRYIPLDPSNAEDPHILSSMLYISRTGDKSYGRQAINEYIEQLSGRPIRFEREEYGDVEMHFGDASYVAKTFYLVEKDLTGRLFQYLKKFVGSDFNTNVFGTFYKPAELITLILRHVKTTTEAYLQQEVDGVVLGRPVKYSEQEETNRRSVKSMRAACHAAGFQTVEFQYEPVAAAFNYALGVHASENILIFDFGGGTFDATVVNVQQTRSNVLGLAGVPVGGSDFDRSIMYEKIAPYFGKGAKVKGDRWVPDNTFLELLNWQTIMQLNKDRRFLRNLRDWLFYAEDPKPFKALERLVKENHGFAIFQEIETAKKRLSTDAQATVGYLVPEVFDGEGEIAIRQPITRAEFQTILAGYTEKIMHCIDETLRMANLTASNIRHVIRVGGSAKIPFFHNLLLRKFGPAKLVMQDEFKNVAGGLAVEAFAKH